MEIDREKQRQAIRNANRILEDTKKQQAAIRLEKCFRDFSLGKIDVLESDEIAQNIPHFLYAMQEDEHHELVVNVLKNLGRGVVHSDRKLRERSVMVLSIYISICLSNRDDRYYDSVSALLSAWLREEREFIAGFEFLCQQFQAIMDHNMEMGRWGESENLFVILFQVCEGVIEKPNIIRQVVVRMLGNLATEENIEPLLDCYLDINDEWRNVAGNILTHMGPNAQAYLLEKLIVEEEKESRLLLIEMIPSSTTIVNMVGDILQSDPPWYVVRNLVLILSRDKGDAAFNMIRPFARHYDMRVQQQVVNGIWKIGGEKLHERLTSILGEINDELKIPLIYQLAQFAGNDQVSRGLLDYLETRDSFSRLLKEDILLSLIQTLKNYPTAEVLTRLKGLLVEVKEWSGEHDQLEGLVVKTIENISNVLAGRTAEGNDRIEIPDLEGIEDLFDDDEMSGTLELDE